MEDPSSANFSANVICEWYRLSDLRIIRGIIIVSFNCFLLLYSLILVRPAALAIFNTIILELKVDDTFEFDPLLKVI